MSNENIKTYVLYTDGGCHVKPHCDSYIGAWAFIIKNGQMLKDGKEMYGLLPQTNSQRAEIIAIIKGLKKIQQDNNTKDIIVEVHTDSEVVIKMFKNKSYSKLQLNNWKLKDGRLFYNQDVWRDLIYYVKMFRKVNFTHVPAHSGYKFNEKCDKLVQETIRKEERKLREQKLIEKLKDEGINLYTCKVEELPSNLKTKGMLRIDRLYPTSQPVAKWFNGRSTVSLYDINLGIIPLDNIAEKCRARNYFEIYYNHKIDCGEINAKEESWNWLADKYGIEKYTDFINVDEEICLNIINDLIPYLRKNKLKSDDKGIYE